MESIYFLLFMMGKVLLFAFSSPIFLGVYFLLFALIAWHYKKIETTAREITSSSNNSFILSAVYSAIIGLVGAFFGSILLILFGIDLYSVGIMYIWIIAILLMFINPRFLCFAYAGGILALISFVFGFPHINIPQLIGLVAILHMVESVLILISGHLHPLPVYVKKDEEIRGGFNMQKFWPLPLIALVGMSMTEPVSGVNMPEWWPLLKDYSEFADDKIYILLPVLAILGYGEINTTSTPKARRRKTAFYLFLYSLVLLALAVLASNKPIFLPLVILFGPLGHELVVWLGRQEENMKTPIYTRPSDGIGVLAVETNSLSHKLGVKSGDVILSVNGEIVNKNRDILDIVSQGMRIDLLIKRNGEIFNLSGIKGRSENLGLIFMPDGEVRKYLTVK